MLKKDGWVTSDNQFFITEKAAQLHEEELEKFALEETLQEYANEVSMDEKEGWEQFDVTNDEDCDDQDVTFDPENAKSVDEIKFVYLHERIINDRVISYRRT